MKIICPECQKEVKECDMCDQELDENDMVYCHEEGTNHFCSESCATRNILAECNETWLEKEE